MESTTNDKQEKQFLGGFELFTPSIEILKFNLKTFIALGAIPFVLLALGTIASGMATDHPHGGDGSGFNFLGGIAMLIVTPGIITAQLKSIQKQTIEPMDALQQGLKYFWRIVGTTLLQMLIYIVSILALVVPLFFAIRRYILTPYYVVDRNMRVIDALKKSAQDSVAFKSPMWGFVGVTVLISAASIVPVIGWIGGWIASILYAGAAAYRYHEISDATKSSMHTKKSKKVVEAEEKS